MIAPPTDSLYKFIALFGLAILAWGFTFAAPLEADYRVKAAELTALTKASSIEAMRYKEMRDDLKEQQNRVSENSSAWGDLETQKASLTLKMVKLESDLAVQEAKVLAVSAEIARYALIGPVARWCGAVLAVLGFVLWYVKIQRYLDSKAARE